ncbi:F-box/kelch-repeat protein At3g23880-like [Rhododendron vialii]|uniref:F-box/kelch-repeat protein At3g23880-like n=1 Tax=Rhododendron vialii TaxID=182163 RepID=UPI00265D68E1|nr:F-box/kelch-repeat protein At3g23880-like [Rhododendron vialii]
MATESSSSCQEPETTSQTHLPTEDSLLLPDLLPELIVEILSRLPVKSLLRFRCVSKSWRSLISRPEFAKTHLSLASMGTDYTHHHRLILSYPYPHTDVKSCSLYSILNEQCDTAVDLDFPSKVSNHRGTIVGCCDGLVCVASDREVFIWNPSTRKSKRLPDVEIPSPYHYIAMHGFGYDESIDDYKVAVFSCDANNYNRGFEAEGKVYSLRTNSWRRIGGFPRCLHMDVSGTYLNRALHWIVSRESDAIIISLDLAEETYGEVLLPDYGDGHLCRSFLDVLNGCLRIVCAYHEYVDVWVLKEYGIRESWTKLVVIPRAIPRATHPLGRHYPTPVCILKNDEVLVNVYTHLVRYNPKDGTSIHLLIRNCSEQFIVYPYIESLVSPDIDVDSGIQWQHQYSREQR